MQISFSLPHYDSPTTSRVERERVQLVLKNAVSALQHAHGVSRTASASQPSGAVLGSGLNKRFIFNLPSFFNTQSSQTDDDKALRILLDALTDINSIYLDYRNNVPLLYPRGAKPVYRNGPVFYERTRIWDPIPALYIRGYGDCKSLTAALIAQLRKDKIEAYPVFRWFRAENPFKKGDTNYHILVQHEKGFEDPSKVLGMGKNARY